MKRTASAPRTQGACPGLRLARGTAAPHELRDGDVADQVTELLELILGFAALGKGNGYKTHRAFMDGKVDLSPNSEIMSFARRIKLNVSKDLDDKYKFFVADVTVHFKNGASEHYFQERAKGSPIKPFTPEFFHSKLDELTEEVIGRKQAGELFGMVDEMRLDRPASEVMALPRSA